MKAISLLYHDVVNPGQFRQSGFAGRDADIYKIDREVFQKHVRLVTERIAPAAQAVTELLDGERSRPVLIWTFDDGGRGALAHTAPLLEEQGWVGHFFVATDYVGTSGFLTKEQIVELHRRGHVIGSHSCSHPTRMSHCSHDRLLKEWRRSVETLSEIVQEPVVTASVPGGYYSRVVAETAAVAGIRWLFNSEPTDRVRSIQGCRVLGRFSIQRSTKTQMLLALVQGRPGPRLQQMLLWNGKKLAKKLGGQYWLRARKSILRRM